MIKTITATNEQELWLESEQNCTLSSHSKGFETIAIGKFSDICNIYSYWTELRSRLSILIDEVEFIDDLVWIKDKLDNWRFGLSFFSQEKWRLNVTV